MALRKGKVFRGEGGNGHLEEPPLCVTECVGFVDEATKMAFRRWRINGSGMIQGGRGVKGETKVSQPQTTCRIIRS